jgi:hypothetical protein
MLNGWDAAVIIYIVWSLRHVRSLGPACIVLWGVWRATRRMNMRDKGELFDEKGRKWVHTFCGTILRIGITADNLAVQYCWKCELVIEDDPPEPDERDDLPEGQPVDLDRCHGQGCKAETACRLI